MLAVMNDSGGAPGPERAFITRLTGGRRALRAASGRAGKRRVAGGRVKEAFNSPSAWSAPGSSPRPWYSLELGLSVFGAGPGCGVWGGGQGPKPFPQVRQFKV